MTDAAPLPPHAYIPGRTPRHPEGVFDPVRASVRPGMSRAELAGSAALATGIAYLRAGYFWEAHEVLEAVWLACPPNSAEQVFVRGLIQWANARLKARMDQPRAAARLRLMATDLLREAVSRGGDHLLGCALAPWQEAVNGAI